ncbi:MAG: SDR family oxidoreductase [Candidatus Methylacidiphilales bacterium]|nr:SDR family oxidoreductase [Candidatus Methylacidiphilales bacterium]
MNPPGVLSGRHILVTGAGGALGRGLTAACAAAGATVGAFIRQRPPGPEVRASAAPDLQDVDSVARALGEIESVSGPVHALIHAAATHGDRLVARQSTASWSEMAEQPLRSAFTCSRAVLPGFFRSGGGDILYIGSLASMRPQPGQCAYAAAKGALESLARAQARELAPKNIRVNCLAPGFIDSPRLSAFSPEQLDALRALVPLARWASVAEVSAWAVFLLSHRASYLTGQTIRIDGGASI